MMDVKQTGKTRKNEKNGMVRGEIKINMKISY